MKTLKEKFLIFISILFIFTACDNKIDPPLDPPLDPHPESIGDEADFQKMIIQYGLSTFQKVISEGDENVLISPLSLESALYMTMNGCDGNTLEEFRIALKSEQFYPPGLNIHYKKLIEKLMPKNESTTLGLANTVFYDEDKVDFHDSFEDIIKETFDGDFIQTDFSDPSSVILINDWVKDKTENRIEKILDNIQPDEVLFLINTLFFQADWDKGFSSTSNENSIFTKENGDTPISVFMKSDTYRELYFGSDFSAVDLKFKNYEYSMTFILPRRDMTVNSFVNGFTEKEFCDFYSDLYTNKLYEDRIMIRVPKFEIEMHKDMKNILKDMGMKTAFENSDLSRMGIFSAQTYLSRVLHDTYLKIDENGVEGVASTAVGTGAISFPPSIFLDKPFLFIIRHVETNTPIFIGKLGDPS